MEKNKKLYTHEPDGDIVTWYVFGWYGPRFAVSTVRNAKLKDYKRYYHMDEVGSRIFFSRNEAKAAPCISYNFCVREYVLPKSYN